jgi:microcystin degradation protein MlrC
MAEKGEGMRIAVASFSHETCTFNPTPTTVEDFEWGGVPRGQAVLDENRGVSTYMTLLVNSPKAS